MARDLLHAGLLADPRTARYHELTADPPDWVVRRVAHLEPKYLGRRSSTRRSTSCTGITSDGSGRAWRSVWPGRPGWIINGDGPGLLLSLAACRPVGALLTWQGAAGRAHDFTCGYARVCPWCHARKVLELHDRLVAGPCRPGRMEGKHLVRVGVKIHGDDLRSNECFAEFARRHGHVVTRHGKRWQFGGLLRKRTDLYPADVRTIRDFLAVMLGRSLRGSASPGGSSPTRSGRS